MPTNEKADEVVARLGRRGIRSLLFVAATRARDALTISWYGDPSRFLRPLGVTRR
ncbi:hypothetical protein ACFV6E_08480 [Streptomyces sp. NPDC059785]|uniref:hypothetical protein n=1 Tax=unclassified Streptomyces TaxID=2593676 RepID=UPI0036616E26